MGATPRCDHVDTYCPSTVVLTTPRKPGENPGATGDVPAGKRSREPLCYEIGMYEVRPIACCTFLLHMDHILEISRCAIGRFISTSLGEEMAGPASPSRQKAWLGCLLITNERECDPEDLASKNGVIYLLLSRHSRLVKLHTGSKLETTYYVSLTNRALPADTYLGMRGAAHTGKVYEEGTAVPMPSARDPPFSFLRGPYQTGTAQTSSEVPALRQQTCTLYELQVGGPIGMNDGCRLPATSIRSPPPSPKCR